MRQPSNTQVGRKLYITARTCALLVHLQGQHRFVLFTEQLLGFIFDQCTQSWTHQIYVYVSHIHTQFRHFMLWYQHTCVYAYIKLIGEYNITQVVTYLLHTARAIACYCVLNRPRAHRVHRQHVWYTFHMCTVSHYCCSIGT